MEPISMTLGAIATYDLLRTTAGKVREDAPKVAETARGLWRKVSGKNVNESPPPLNSVASGAQKTELTADSENHGAAVTELQNQVRVTLEVTNALAEQSVRFADFVEATRQSFEVVEKQNNQLIARLEADALAIKALENQSSLLFKRVEADSELLKRLEAQNAQLAKDLEVERSRIGQLTGMCIAIGLIAVVGLVMAVRMAMQ